MRTKGKSKTAAMMAAAVLCGGVAAEAANLVVTAPSNYAQSVMGVVRGSRVKTDIWGVEKDLRTVIAGDDEVIPPGRRGVGIHRRGNCSRAFRG